MLLHVSKKYFTFIYAPWNQECFLSLVKVMIFLSKRHLSLFLLFLLWKQYVKIHPTEKSAVAKEIANKFFSAGCLVTLVTFMTQGINVQRYLKKSSAYFKMSSLEKGNMTNIYRNLNYFEILSWDQKLLERTICSTRKNSFCTLYDGMPNIQTTCKRWPACISDSLHEELFYQMNAQSK